MCGRYALTLPPDAVRQYFGYTDQPNFPPRYNIAPTQPVPVVHRQDGVRRFTLMRWGFIPGWVKDPKDFPLIINIRSETAREKASFRAAIQRRRALMPADGFYEWQRLGRESRPFLLRRPDRAVFAFAALWETYMSSDGSEIDTVALLNTTANGVIAAIHERSPVILPPDQFEAWLDPETPAERALGLLRPPADDLLEMIPIGRAVNKVANDSPAVQEPEAAKRESPTPPSPPKRKASARAPDEGQGGLFD
jgi:putative SOS response-associated peptidase YedK